ncbi:MAG: hypothetical protein VX906_05040, partial [Candidatus Thermoplasmatota archaeon]|nr:hypothetical protein [Candidatus Thermoplasmatota archaeon]
DVNGIVNIDEKNRIFRPDMECEICGEPPFRVSWNVWHCDEHGEKANCRNFAKPPYFSLFGKETKMKNPPLDSLSHDKQHQSEEQE